MRQGGIRSRFKLGPAAVHRSCATRWNIPGPPHYVVTFPARIGRRPQAAAAGAPLLPHPVGPRLSGQVEGNPMSTAFNILAILVMVAVVIVLIRGLINMMRGGSATRPTS
jgi:hypothetical protein